MSPIPVVDVFAGPGGLGEGFVSLLDKHRERLFRISLSIEKDPQAHKTLVLRSFFRQFLVGDAPRAYYKFISEEMSLDELFAKFPKEAESARRDAWMAELGREPVGEIDKRISSALEDEKIWVLIGGPPCQAYSIVGRSRMGGIGASDPRVYLYREYFRILAVHNPPVFVMENVKGVLSAKVFDKKVFGQILSDLADPVKAYHGLNGNHSKLECPGYRIFSLVTQPSSYDERGNPLYEQEDFIIRSEDYGIPQSRHRVILLGIRRDINVAPSVIQTLPHVAIGEVIKDLPRVRSGVSKTRDSAEKWKTVLGELVSNGLLDGVPEVLRSQIRSVAKRLSIPHNDRGGEFLKWIPSIDYKPRWFLDRKLGGIANHAGRTHMKYDLFRYLYAACFAKLYHRSPKLADFPKHLWPKHENMKKAITENMFSDRFRVQVWKEPSRTITSHISKDGHYYIHPDPTQCRSLTVREAARIQTFPDNYFFCGPRTSQYVQVGNAVPPLLARQIAQIVFALLKQSTLRKTSLPPDRIEK